MKKLLLIVTIAISSLSFGQITLEHTYTTEGFNNYPKSYAFHTDNGLFYYTINSLENKVLIYNPSHILFKTANLNVGIGYTINTIYLATDKLFNSNSKIEFIVVSRNGTPNSSKMTLFDEDGANLFEFGDRWEANFIKNSDTSFKLIVSTDKDSPNNYDIYSLPGTLSIIQQQTFNKNQFFGYPNPASNKITIINNLKEGENGLLEIFDINGKRIMEKNVLGNETEINLDVANFENGVYIYKLNGKTNRFIKN
ncbi:Secretion system C-terminal sorting domain [Flavobacteriaceae bacterium]